MIPNWFPVISGVAQWVSLLQAGLHSFCGTWLRYNSLEWNSHSSSLCAVQGWTSVVSAGCVGATLALHPNNRTLQPVQLQFLG